MARTSRFLLPLLLCTLLLDTCPAKPTDTLANPESLDPVRQPGIVTATDAVASRGQRSSQYGLRVWTDDYSDYSEEKAEEEEDERILDYRHKHKHHKHKPGGYISYPEGHYGGYKPPEPYYPAPSGGGGSFATASAGSIDLHGKPHGGQSHANAQSASFSFGPYSATFSVAEASSGRHRY